nr:hypothetical protein HK105_003738 [Polyrhizophydium stewartii]
MLANQTGDARLRLRSVLPRPTPRAILDSDDSQSADGDLDDDERVSLPGSAHTQRRQTATFGPPPHQTPTPTYESYDEPPLRHHDGRVRDTGDSGDDVACVCGAYDHEGEQLLNEVFDLPLVYLAATMFGDTGPKLHVKASIERGAKDLIDGKWSEPDDPAMPCKRSLTYVVHIKNAVFGTIGTRGIEEQSLVRNDAEGCVFEATAQTPDVPYGSVFSMHQRICLASLGISRTRMQLHAQVRFARRLFLQHTISSAALEGIRDFAQILRRLVLLESQREAESVAEASRATAAAVAIAAKNQTLMPQAMTVAISPDFDARNEGTASPALSMPDLFNGGGVRQRPRLLGPRGPHTEEPSLASHAFATGAQPSLAEQAARRLANPLVSSTPARRLSAESIQAPTPPLLASDAAQGTTAGASSIDRPRLSTPVPIPRRQGGSAESLRSAFSISRPWKVSALPQIGASAAALSSSAPDPMTSAFSADRPLTPLSGDGVGSSAAETRRVREIAVWDGTKWVKMVRPNDPSSPPDPPPRFTTKVISNSSGVPRIARVRLLPPTLSTNTQAQGATSPMTRHRATSTPNSFAPSQTCSHRRSRDGDDSFSDASEIAMAQSLPGDWYSGSYMDHDCDECRAAIPPRHVFHYIMLESIKQLVVPVLIRTIGVSGVLQLAWACANLIFGGLLWLTDAFMKFMEKVPPPS